MMQVMKRTLLLGDPIHIHWALPGWQPGEDDESPVYLKRLVAALQENLRALSQGGFLHGLLSQRHRTHRILDTLREGLVAHDEYRSIYLFNSAAEGWHTKTKNP